MLRFEAQMWNHRWVWLAVGVGFALAVVLFIAGALVPGATRLTWGFSAYYTGARLLVEGVDMSRLYDPGWFRAQVASFGITGPQASDIWFINPPTTALLMAPLAAFTPLAARLAWTFLNLVMLLAALWLIARALRVQLSPKGWMLVATGVLLFHPLYENFRWGQAYVLVLLLHALFLYAYLESVSRLASADRHLRRCDLITAFALASMLVLKTYGALLMLFLLSRRRWRALLYTLVVAGLVALLTLPRLTTSIWETYLFEVLPKVRGYAGMGITGYQTLSSFVAHLFRYDPVGSPQPLVDVPRLAAGMAVALIGLVLLVTLRACHWPGRWERDFEALSVAAFTAISVPLAPVAEEHHFTVLILPLMVLGAYLLRRSWLVQGFTAYITTSRAIGLVSYGLLTAPLPFMHPRLVREWWALLAYPKLYGALLLWLALLFPLWACRDALAKGRHPSGDRTEDRVIRAVEGGRC